MKISRILGSLVLVLVLVLGLVSTACGATAVSDDDDDDDDSAMEGDDGEGEGLSQWEGYYEGDFGPMLLIQVGSEIRGAYNWDEGTFVGTADGGVLTGWWSESPTRAPCDDAGQLRFILDGDRLDGSWSYGMADGQWAEDWDLQRSNAEPLHALETRLFETDSFLETPDDAPSCGG
jgi:hypothetical protein